MKTVSLEGALKLASKPPLRVLEEFGNRIVDENEEMLVIVENPSTSKFDRTKWETNAAILAHAFNLFPEVVEALKEVRAIIVDAAKEGFNPHAGDWANRLYASQGMSHDVVKRAETVQLPD
jgi:hypothetical protein